MPTILYVDDEAPLRRAVTAWLTRRGTVVHSAPSIETAKRCVDQFALDGCFIDLWLTDGSGFELFDWLADHHCALAANVVFVTGDIVSTQQTQRHFAMLGRPVLTKPFDLAMLDRYVEQWSRHGAATA
jgi:DNA-binding NtrC family response regulator